jgi:hypothetical protein
VIGTLVTGVDSLHTAKSLPLPGLPPGMTLQELGVAVLAGCWKFSRSRSAVAGAAVRRVDDDLRVHQRARTGAAELDRRRPAAHRHRRAAVDRRALLLGVGEQVAGLVDLESGGRRGQVRAEHLLVVHLDRDAGVHELGLLAPFITSGRDEHGGGERTRTRVLRFAWCMCG